MNRGSGAGTLAKGRVIVWVLAIAALTVAALVAFAWLRGRQPIGPAGPPIRIGAYYWPGTYWFDIAHKKGWFAEAGLDVEWVDTNADYFGSFDQLLAGELDVVNMPQFDLLLLNGRGDEFVGVVISDCTSGAEALVARPGIDSVAALEGGRLGLARGSYLEYVWIIVAQRYGIDLARVEIVDVPAEAAPELLGRGELDAILVWEPLATKALESVGGTMLFETSLMPNVICSLVTLRPDFVAERREDVLRFTSVWLRTARFIEQNPDEAFAIVAEVNGTTLADVRSFAQTETLLDLEDNLVAFSQASGLDSLYGSSRRMIDFLVSRALIQERPDTLKVFDSRFVRELGDGVRSP